MNGNTKKQEGFVLNKDSKVSAKETEFPGVTQACDDDLSNMSRPVHQAFTNHNVSKRSKRDRRGFQSDFKKIIKNVDQTRMLTDKKL